MKNFIFNLKMNKADDGNGAGGGKSEEKPTTPTNPPKAEEKGDSEFDQFGYAKTPSEGDKKPEDKKPVEPPPKEEVVTPATGYGQKPPEPPKEEEKPAEEKPPEKIDLGYELNLDGLDAEEAKKIQEFAKEMNATEEQAKKYVEKRKSEIKAQTEAAAQAEKLAIENFEKEKQKIRASWDKELREDPVFGGEKFEHNLKQAEKVLEDFWPEMKKELTKRGSMLPPYHMRGLMRVAEHLYSTEKLKQGNPVVPAEEPKKENDHLSFYTNG